MPDFTRKLTVLSCLLFTGFCFWKAAFGLVDVTDASVVPTAQAAFRAPTITNKRLITTPIQKLQPGMRVLGRNPDRLDTQPAIEPNPVSWRLVSVRMEHKPGEYVLGKLLRPTSWIRGNQAQPGTAISLEIPEMNVSGVAEVLSIEACPLIKVGPGSVVTGTFEHVSNNVISVFVEGEVKPIGTTAKHPFWSKDRSAFVPAGELRIGEELKTALGTSPRVTSIEIRAGPETVYGLEVAGEHVYQITNAGLLVHNASGRNSPSVGHSYPDNVTTYAARKAHRKEVAESTWTSHGRKHLQARTLDEARIFSSDGGAAQYVPGLNNKALEKLATQKGFVIDRGNTKYFYYKSDKIIGYDNGTETQWIRAEITSRVYHGHPMRVDRLPKDVRDEFGL